MKKTKRLFVAVNVPPETKREIAEFLEMIPKDKWRKVKQENLHITLVFLGWNTEEQAKKAMQAVQELQGCGEFEIELNGFGHFDGRVLWMGIGKGTEELNAISRKLNQSLHTRDERFHAHITLARNKGAKREEAKGLVEKMRKLPYKKIVQVKTIELMESILHTSGPEYKTIFSVQLES